MRLMRRAVRHVATNRDARHGTSDKTTCDIFQNLIQKKTVHGRIREPQQPAKQSKPANAEGSTQKMATHIQKVCNTKTALTCLALYCIQVGTRDNSR